MKKRDILKIKSNVPNKRRLYKDIKSFIDENKNLDGKILTLCGLRRTGKTVLLEQIVEEYRDTKKCAFYEVTNNDSMDDIIANVLKEQKNGVEILFLDEITKAYDFITNSAILADVFAKENMKIIVAGTDSLSFVFAEDRELFDRTIQIKTTYIPFAEHCDVLGTNNIDNYIMYGGLMKKGAEDKEKNEEFMKKYVDEAVSLNIAYSIKNDFHNNCLDALSEKEIRTIIEKLVEKYSGAFNKKEMQNELKKTSIDIPAVKILAKDYKDYYISLFSQKKDITKDFIKRINAEQSIKTNITEDMVLKLENYLINLDLLSVVDKVSYNYNDDIGWTNTTTEKEAYIIQPAIKYYHLQKGKSFIEQEKYYAELPYNLKNKMQDRLDSFIKGLMTEQIILFETSKILDAKKYYVCKPDFSFNGQKQGELDMLIYDKTKNEYYGFEIKHSDKAVKEQYKHLTDQEIKEKLDYEYGNRKNVSVLYRGNPFKSSDGVNYINLNKFIKSLDKTQDVEKTIDILTKGLNEYIVYPRTENKEHELIKKSDINVVSEYIDSMIIDNDLDNNIDNIHKDDYNYYNDGFEPGED